jgi:hypothetical protein
VSSSAEFSVREVIVAPGGEEVINLTIRNIGPSPENFSLIATGLAQAWMLVEPASVALPPGSFETVRVTLRPPRSWAIGAGPTPFGVRVVPYGGIDEVTIADGVVTVLGFDDRRLHLAQPVQRSRRRAEYDLIVENNGNSQASCRLVLLDGTGRVTGKFQPPSVGVDPGMSQPSRLTLVARRRRWRKSRSLQFFVQATQDGHPSIEVGGTLLQEPLIAARAIVRVAALGAAAAIVVGGWFGLVKPAIDDAAERAVAKAGLPALPTDPSLTTVAGAQPVGATSTPTSVGLGTDVPAVAVPTTKESFDTRLEASAAIGEQGVGDYTVPAGQRLRISDVLLQNPSRDLGILTLLRNGESVYEASLDNITDYAIPFVGSLVFESGETVTLQITCQGVGSPSNNSCIIGATLVGTLEPT